MSSPVPHHRPVPGRRLAAPAELRPRRRRARFAAAVAVAVGTLGAVVLPAAPSLATSTTVQVVPLSDGSTPYAVGGALAVGQTFAVGAQDMIVTSAVLRLDGVTDPYPEMSICAVDGAGLPVPGSCGAATSTANAGGTVTGSFTAAPPRLGAGGTYAVIVRVRMSAGGAYGYYASPNLNVDESTDYPAGHMVFDYEANAGQLDDYWYAAADAGMPDADLPLALTYDPPEAPAITTTTLASGAVGQPYSVSLSATGAPAPTWALSTGSLPPGLTMTSAGVISGTPTSVGTASFTVRAGNGVGSDATQALTLRIDAAVPSSPDSVALTPGDQTLTATWPASTSTGGATVTYDVEYQVTGDAGWTAVENTSSRTSTVTGLTVGAEYTVRVRGRNSAGPAVSWTSSAPMILPGRPSVSGVAVAEGDQTATVSWSEVGNGSAVDSADLQYRPVGAPSWTTDSFSVTGATGSRTLAGLTNRTPYEYALTVHNAIGDSTAVSGTFTPFLLVTGFTSGGEVLGSRSRVPGAPVSGDASGVPTGRTLQLVYAPGTADERVLATATADTAGLAELTAALPADAAVGAQSVGLRVVGTTALVTAGVTIVVPTSASWTPAAGTYREAYSSAVTLGGTGALVTAMAGLPAGLAWSADGTVSGTPVEVGTFPITVSVQGDSGTVTLAVDLTIDAAAPGVVGGPVVTGSTSQPGELHVRWTAPGSAGAPGALAFTVRYRLAPAGAWTTLAPTTTTSVTVTGLTMGGTYDAEVTATNTSDVSGAAASASGTVWVPSQVSSLVATPADGAVALTWVTSAAGLTVEKYVVERQAAGGPVVGRELTDLTPGTTITGLTNGTSYTFSVVACTVFAVGEPCVVGSAAVATATPATPPGAPVIGTATAGDGQATVTWQAPADDGGSALTGYRVDYRPTGSGAWTPGATTVASATQATVTGLTDSTEYEFRVVATNAVGTSVASPSAVAVPFRLAPGYTTADGRPLELSAITSGTSITMTGSGAPPGATISLELHSTPILLGTTVVAADGTYRLTVTVPAGVTGNHTLVATMVGAAPVGTAVGVVTPAVASSGAAGTTTVTRSDALAATGSDAAAIATSALLLLLVGAGLVVGTRVRRRG